MTHAGDEGPLWGMIGGASYALALLALLVVAFHGLATGLPFLLHYYDNVTRENDRRPSIRSYIRAYMSECYFAAAIWLSYPFGIFGGSVHDRFEPDGGPPIVLVHGYAMNRASFFSLYWRLRRAGYRNLFVISLRPLMSPLTHQAERLERIVGLVATVAGGSPVVGIGHSQGGILLRWLAVRSQAPLERVITIGSPHRGTRLAYLSLGANAREMRPNSKVLNELESTSRVPIVSIYSDVDQIVNPAESAKLGSDSKFYAEAGHFTLLHSSAVFDGVLGALPPSNTVNSASDALDQEPTG